MVVCNTVTAHGVCLLLCRNMNMFELFDPNADVCIRDGSSLPHWYQAGVSYFVTFRTEDSIPIDVSRRWHAQRADWLRRNGISPDDPKWRDRLVQLPEAARRQYHETFSRQYLEARQGPRRLPASPFGTAGYCWRQSASLRRRSLPFGQFRRDAQPRPFACVSAGRHGNRVAVCFVETVHGSSNQSKPRDERTFLAGGEL